MTLSTGFGSTSALDNRIVVGNSLAVGSMVFWAAGFPATDAANCKMLRGRVGLLLDFLDLELVLLCCCLRSGTLTL